VEPLRAPLVILAMIPRVSVIIPTLDERGRLEPLLADLAAQAGVRLTVLIADGGSRDGGPARWRGRGHTVIDAPRGRGAQLNAGHRHATDPWRVFLHADSRLTHPRQIADAVAHLVGHDPRRTAGHWPLRFTGRPPGHDRLFAFMEAKTRSGRPGTIHGDQGLLIHRDFLDALGGFSEDLPFFEDVYLSEAVFRHGRWTLLPGVLETSARRFAREGVRQRYALMGLMMALHAAGQTDFLREWPALYRAQSETDRLRLMPFLRPAVRRLLGRPPAWPRLLRYAWAERWQLRLAVEHLGRQRSLSPGP
jgi:rSAM/selenodomain-associated transferase 2